MFYFFFYLLLISPIIQEPNEAGLPPSITPATSSTNLVYFHGDLVVKFYTKAGLRESSFEKEKELYNLLQTATDSPSCFPTMKAHGVYKDTDEKEWPYIITNLVDGEPIGAVFPELSHDNRLEVAEFAARMLKEVHAMDISSVKSVPITWQPFIDYLCIQRDAATKRHEHWQTMPGSLIRQLGAYLPTIHELRTSFVNTSRSPVLVHSDLNDENLLGEWEDLDEEEEEEEEKGKQGKEKEKVWRFYYYLLLLKFNSFDDTKVQWTRTCSR